MGLFQEFVKFPVSSDQHLEGEFDLGGQIHSPKSWGATWHIQHMNHPMSFSGPASGETKHWEKMNENPQKHASDL